MLREYSNYLEQLERQKVDCPFTKNNLYCARTLRCQCLNRYQCDKWYKAHQQVGAGTLPSKESWRP